MGHGLTLFRGMLVHIIQIWTVRLLPMPLGMGGSRGTLTTRSVSAANYVRKHAGGSPFLGDNHALFPGKIAVEASSGKSEVGNRGFATGVKF
jgi:hypothetical protein